MTLLDFVNIFLAVGVVLSQFFILLAIVYIFLPFNKNIVSRFFSKNGISLAFIVSVLATTVSLFYSNYAGFEPCVLCWYQRIFMYPQVIILGIALLKNNIEEERKIIDYSLALSILGGVISIYHNYIYFMGVHAKVCSATESCITPYITEFGYITIPVMALTGFALMSLLLIIKKIYDKKF